MSTQSDEIDLLGLAAKLIVSIKTNFVLILIYFLIGTFLGLGFFMLAPKRYESKLILLSDILTESYSERITESLYNLIKESNYQALAERLNISTEQAKDIVDIEIESVKQKDQKEIKDESSTFIVTVRTSNKSLYPKLQEGIINHLRNNEFVKIRVRQRESFYKAMIQKVQLEINSLDSLKGRLFAGKPIYSKSAEMMLIDPTNIYSKIIELNKELIGYKNSLELVNSIQLVEGFTIFEKPAFPKLSISLVSGAFAGLFFVALVIIYKSVKKVVQLSEEKLTRVAS